MDMNKMNIKLTQKKQMDIYSQMKYQKMPKEK